MRRATAAERRLLTRGLRRWHGPQLPDGIPHRHRLRPDMFNADQLAIGTKVELEHTSDPTLAVEIAMAHLDEDRAYYSKLERMEGRTAGTASMSAGKYIAMGVVVLVAAVAAAAALVKIGRRNGF